MPKKYLTIKQAAQLIGVTPLTLRNWDKKGKLAAIRHPINNYRVYDLSDLENFLIKIEARKPRKIEVRLAKEDS